MRIREIVLGLVKKYQTRCPYRLAEWKGVIVKFEVLGSIYGYFSMYYRIPIIHINVDLEFPLQRFVCAHELGHAILHRKVNTPFLRAHTLFSVDRLEREANEFAAELLIPDEAIRQHETVSGVAAACEVPVEIVKIKKWMR